MATITGTNVTRSMTQSGSTSLWGNLYVGAGTADILSTSESSTRFGTFFTISVSNSGIITLTSTSGGNKTAQFQGFEQFKFSDVTINLGTAGADTITGGSGNDTWLYGLGGNDTISGGTGGTDTVVMQGARANYTVTAVGSNYQIVDNTGADGTDTLISIENVRFTDQTATVASLVTVVTPPATITGDANPNTLTGNSVNNTIYGLGGNDTITASGGTDTMYGGAGDDIYIINDAGGHVVVENAGEGTADTVQSAITYTLTANVENLTLTGSAAINGTGNGDANTITGNGAANTLNGGAGNDTLRGGAGNDTIVGGGGTDTAVFSGNKASYSVTTADGISGTITGPDGTDTLTNIANLQFGDGTFTLMSFKPATGGGNTPTSGADSLIGTSGNDTIDGLGGNDTINGLAGNDMLTGGAGNDTIIGGGGIDTAVFSGSKASYTVTTADGISGTVTGPDGTDTLNNITSLKFADGTFTFLSFKPATGGGNTPTSGADTLTGTSGADSINGLGGDDTINGAGGNDMLTGGAGNDTIIGGGGSDTAVFSGNKASYVVTTTDGISGTVTGPDGTDTLSNITSLKFADGTVTFLSFKPVTGGGTGSGVIYGTSVADNIVGTAAADTIKTGSGNDTINGGGGGDSMWGGRGNDIYIYDNSGDSARELSGAGQGDDTIRSSVSIGGLQSNVEHLKLTGNSNLHGTGNGLSNHLVGNAGDNILKGLGGNDLLVGGLGHDVMTGGTGKDVFDFNTLDSSMVGARRDVITDFTHGVDKINLFTIDANGDDVGNGKFIMQVSKGVGFTGYESQLHYKWDGANTIIEADFNGDRQVDFQIELTGHKVLTASDFIL